MVDAWCPSVRRSTAKTHVILTGGSISPDATAKSPGHPPAQRATPNDHVMLTIGGISPDTTVKLSGYIMVLCDTAGHTENPCHADGRRHLAGCLGIARRGTAQSVRWFTPFTMTVLFVVIFIAIAWCPLMQRATPNDHVMLTIGSISPHASESQGVALRNQRDGSLHSP